MSYKSSKLNMKETEYMKPSIRVVEIASESIICESASVQQLHEGDAGVNLPLPTQDFGVNGIWGD